jgi:hypothetical protein
MTFDNWIHTYTFPRLTSDEDDTYCAFPDARTAQYNPQLHLPPQHSHLR